MIKKLYAQYKEIVDYLFWGVVAFLLSMILYWVFVEICGWKDLWSNIIDWVICVIFTYVTNRTFVFRSKVKDFKGITKEFIEFVSARFFTLVLEEIIIFVGGTLLGYDKGLGAMVVKFIGQAVVIITNYILSKLWIFKKDKKNEQETS